ncbi:MAG: hypothetical protein HFJ46_04625 [Clostridia bacterium]|nr:hypothetical protein [Clostridia bacterium]
MNKTVKTIIIIVAVIAIILGVYIAISLINKKPKTNLDPVKSGEDLIGLVDKIYSEMSEEELPMLESQLLDLTNNDTVKYITGLDNGTDFEYVVVSEPLMSSQAYSLVIAKVQSGVNADKVAKEMSEKVDTRKWICVEAEKLYATSSGDIVFLVMTNEGTAKPIFERFKTLAGNVNEVYEKNAAEIELPPEMY